MICWQLHLLRCSWICMAASWMVRPAPVLLKSTTAHFSWCSWNTHVMRFAMSAWWASKTYLCIPIDSIGRVKMRANASKLLLSKLANLRIDTKHDSFWASMWCCRNWQWLGKQRRASWRSKRHWSLIAKVYQLKARDANQLGKFAKGGWSFRIASGTADLISIGPAWNRFSDWRPAEALTAER